MAKLRIRVKLNEGGEGVPLHQMASVARETDRFLRFLAQDMGLSVAKGQLLARNFADGSLSNDVEFPQEYGTDEERQFNAAMDYAATFNPDEQHLNGAVSQRTMLQFAKIADSLAVHEKIAFGLYRQEAQEPYVWRPLTKRRAVSLQEKLFEEALYVGSVRGLIHNLVVETPQWFGLRLMDGGDIIHCDVRREDVYAQVMEAIGTPGGLVYVRGRVRARRIDRHILGIVAEKIKAAPRLSSSDYERFFGVSPNYTGDLSTEEFIDEARAYGA
jgi:hypothetical protein